MTDIININFLCTYHLIKDYTESFMMYKIQFLQIFELDEYDDNIINEKVEKLYNKVKDKEVIKKIINNKKIYDDDLASFMLYFRYDTLYIFHKILINVLEDKSMESYSNLYREIIKIL